MDIFYKFCKFIENSLCMDQLGMGQLGMGLLTICSMYVTITWISWHTACKACVLEDTHLMALFSVGIIMASSSTEPKCLSMFLEEKNHICRYV